MVLMLPSKSNKKWYVQKELFLVDASIDMKL